MIDKSTIDRIHSAANIVDIIGDFVTLKKKGVNYQACCPFHHEKTPSFVVSPSKGYFKCFGCGEGGSAISFVMKHESMSYVEALKYVAAKYGIKVEEREQTAEQKEKQSLRESMMTVNNYAASYFTDQLNNTSEGQNIALSYFRGRGFSDITIEKFGLGFCPSSGDDFSQTALKEGYKEELLVATGLTIKPERGGYYDRFCGRVIFPISSLSGRIIGFGGRIMRSDKKTAKYLNSPESEVYHKSDTLYGISHAKLEISRQNKAILVEGYTDVISMHQSGICNVVASSGTSLTKGQVQLISRFTKNVTVIYDGDWAGIKASLRGIDIILAEGLNVRVVLLPEGDDPDSFALSHTAEELNDYIFQNEVDFLTFKTNLLLESVKNDPLGRAEVVKEVIESISVIPDDIIRNQYISECSTLLSYDINVIRNEVNRKTAKATGDSMALEVEINRQRKEQFQAKNSKQLPLIENSNELYSFEKELITFLLKYGEKNFNFQNGEDVIEVNVATLIFDELEVDGIEFTNQIFREIYNKYKELYNVEEKNRVELSYFLNNDSAEICNFTVDLLTEDEKYKASKIWAKLDEIGDDGEATLDKTLPKSLALYKQKVLSSIRTALCKEAEQNPNDIEILKKIMAVNNSYTQLCKNYSRIL